MKHKYKLLIACIVFSVGNMMAQQNPTGAPTGTFLPLAANTTKPWLRGGNTNSGTGANDNIFGTAFNSPIYTITNNLQRMRLNGTLTATISSVAGQNVSGFLGIAPSGFFANNSPITMLHLYGPNNTTYGIGGGWRKWMSTGIFMNENSDAMYVGMKPEPGTNRSDAIISWNDDGVGTPADIDKLRFMLTGASTGNGSGTNPINNQSLNGYEFMRMTPAYGTLNSTGTPVGFIGIGPVFNDANPPQNRLHMNGEESLPTFMQITSQNGTGQTATDGLKVGYDFTSAINKEAIINQQENDRLSLYANNGERMRIMQIGALNAGIAFNPGGLANNFTRIGISEDPNNPVSKPLSLLHIGYNTGLATLTPGVTDGWRPWMDIGMFISNGTDNGYIGLKAETGGFPAGDRQDMILNWGDNQTAGPLGTGPDNFRFVFTSTTTGAGGSPPATGVNGLEGGRMTPTASTGIFTGFGGDPTPAIGNPYFGGSINPTNTLEVNSWGSVTALGGSSGMRFTDLNATSPTIANPGTGVLGVDSTGKVIYTTSNNRIGNYCSLAPANVLTDDYRIPLTNFNYYFSGQSTNPTKSRVAVGVPCGTTIQFAKFYVKQLVPNNGLSYAGQFADSAAGDNNYGVYSLASQAHNGYGIAGFAHQNTIRNVGVLGQAGGHPVDRAGLFIGQLETTASALITSDQMFKTNVAGIKDALSILKKIQPHTYKMDIAGYPQFNFDDAPQIGFIAQEVETVLPQLVHQSASPAEYDETGAIITPSISYKSLNYIGFIPLTVQAINELGSKVDQSTLSDVSIKTNVHNLTGSLAKVVQMRGVTYDWTTAAQTNLGLDSLQHIGFIAQEIHAIDPLLTFTDSTNLMHVNYDRVVPLLVESIKDLNTQMQQKDSVIHVMQNKDSIQDYRLTMLENALNNCCNVNHALQSNSQSNNTNSSMAIDVTLKDGQSIVLDQNVPNPFAEQTVIKYFLPDNIGKAQMLFYNAQGKLIQATDLTERGQGQLNVFGSDLSNGIYSYTLVVDGKIIETKKMVKQQ